MKKVLIVAYHYPPSDAVGALRPASFARYLPDYGWEPIVIRGPGPEKEAPAQFEPPAGVPVETVPGWPGLRELSQRIRSREGGASGLARTRVSSDGVTDSGWRAAYVETGRSPLRDLVYSMMWLPDDKHGWIPPAVSRVLAAVRTHDPSVILTTSPPHSVQVVGLLASTLSGVPLVTDFRDPWVGNPATPDFIRAGPAAHCHEFMEAQVISCARAVLLATRSHADRVRVHAGAEGKTHVIPNGFDRRVFDGLRVQSSGTFTITYSGNFYHSRTPEPIIRAIGILVSEGIAGPGDLRLELVGNCYTAAGREVAEMAHEAGCEDMVEVTGRLPYRRALERLVSSDLLLLLATEQPEQIPAKAYEYAAAGPPILGLVDAGETADFLASLERSTVLFDHDPAAIATVLERCLRERHPQSTGAWSCPEGAESFERSVGIRQLSGILSEVGGDGG